MSYQYNYRDKPYGHSAAIQDKKVIDFITQFEPDFSKVLSKQIDQEFTSTFIDWINKTNNSIEGIDDLKYAVYSNGTTEGFDKFYQNNSDRRFRCFKGEYLYHKLAWREKDWAFIEDDDILENDAVVVSLPFADTGFKHSAQDEILDICSFLGVPVLLDACYLGISSNVDYNFTWPCITDVTFSLSKVFPVAHARIGMRLTKTDTDDMLFVYAKQGYINRIGAKLGINLMRNFSSNYIFNTYREKQLSMCKDLDVTPSDTVVFGIDYKGIYSEYNRGTNSNRLGLHKFLGEQ